MRSFRLLVRFGLSLCLGFASSAVWLPAGRGDQPRRAVAERAIIVGSDVPLRSEPHRLAAVVQRLSEGETVEVTPGEQQGHYLRVRSTEGVGWIHRSELRRLLSSSTPQRQRALAGDTAVERDAHRSSAEERHLDAGRPVAVYERYRDGYAVGVDARLRIPLWVQYELTSGELNGSGDRDDSRFQADESLPQVARAELGDYRRSGFDRGHMVPAGDMKRSQQAMDESFLLSNIAPQVGQGFNRGVWRLLEEAVRDWTRQRGSLTVISGPIFAASPDGVVTYGVLGENAVAVPTGFFKIVLDREQHEALAFRLPNEAMFDRQFDEFLVSIDQLEAQTGLDFLAALSEQEQLRLEAQPAARPWRVGGETRRLLERAGQDVRLQMIELDEQGRFVDASQFEALIEHARRAQPTHLFLLAHGWNNSRVQAEASYQAVLSLMGDEADRAPDLRPQPYRPLVIGIHWPSKAWDEQSGRLHSLQADEDLTLAIIKVLPSQRAAASYAEDVQELREMLSQPEPQQTDQHRRRAWELLRKYASKPQMPEDESIFDEDAAAATASGMFSADWSVADLFRAFTFWEMKKRAGEVGGRGGSQVLQRLMTTCPDAQLHLGGHSFGCKFWLAALVDGPRLPRRVDSVALVQGAVSSWAFAERVPGTNRPGGYRDALTTVAGAVVATHSSQDWPLRFAYPLGSRLAGQSGELERAAAGEPSKYAALGASGAAGSGRTLRLDGRPIPALEAGLWSIDGSERIDGHSEFYVPEVARLLWATIRTGG